MRPIRPLAVFALASLATLLPGCASSEENCKPAVEGAQPSMGMINAACPMMPDEDARDTGSQAAYAGSNADWKDKNIAFCCAGCVRKWAKLTPAEQEAALAKVAAK
ncbi:MAG: hypothetical protein IT435_09195 [Phycisphaerales bacterium]|nr:hypothetical protein [Phycisphaerales bacterium]